MQSLKNPCDDNLSIIILSRNHQNYISDCLNSIYREFKCNISVLLVDVNSRDRTIQYGSLIAKKLGINLAIKSIGKDEATLIVLGSISDLIKTKNIILISADDALGEGYYEGITKILQNNLQDNIVINFPLTITNADLVKQKSRKSKWSSSLNNNKFKLSISNPGNIAGSLLPWELVKKELDKKSLPPTLIEDYWLWWQLVGKVEFVNSPNGTVIYRRHDSNTSGMKSSSKYAWSLGFSCGIPMISQNNVFFRMLSLMLILRWIRHLKFSVWKEFFNGYFCCIRNHIK